MKKAGFLVRAKHRTVTIGNDDIGSIALPIYNGLIAGEQETLEEVSENLPEPLAEASRLAVRIKSSHNLPDSELLFCFGVVANSEWEAEQRAQIEEDRANKTITTKEADRRLTELKTKAELFTQYRIEHAPEISELNRKLHKAGRLKKFGLVTAIVKHRGAIPLRDELKKLSKMGHLTSDDRDRIEELEEQIEALENWTIEDTKQLHGDFVNALWEFGTKEMNGGKDPEAITGDAVGKQPEVSEEVAESTGETSFGDSEDTGRTTNDLVLVVS